MHLLNASLSPCGLHFIPAFALISRELPRGRLGLMACSLSPRCWRGDIGVEVEDPQGRTPWSCSWKSQRKPGVSMCTSQCSPAPMLSRFLCWGHHPQESLHAGRLKEAGAADCLWLWHWGWLCADRAQPWAQTWSFCCQGLGRKYPQDINTSIYFVLKILTSNSFLYADLSALLILTCWICPQKHFCQDSLSHWEMQDGSCMRRGCLWLRFSDRAGPPGFLYWLPGREHDGS